MVNRNRGSGTRVLIDGLLGERAAAGLRRRAAVALRRRRGGRAGPRRLGRRDRAGRARGRGCGFLPLRDEHYDFAVPASRSTRPAVQALVRLLAEDGTVRAALRALSFEI